VIYWVRVVPSVLARDVWKLLVFLLVGCSSWNVINSHVTMKADVACIQCVSVKVNELQEVVKLTGLSLLTFWCCYCRYKPTRPSSIIARLEDCAQGYAVGSHSAAWWWLCYC